MPPGVTIIPVASRTAVPTSSTTSTSSMVSGLPARPTATTRPSAMPIEAYRTPSSGSSSRPPTIATSTPPRSARTPRPSRIVLPKPGTSWSGPWTSSRSATTSRLVSPRRTGSVGQSRSSGATEALLARGRQRRLAGAGRVQRPVDEVAVAAHDAGAADRRQRHLAPLAGREEDLGAGRHGQAHPPRRGAVEVEHAVGLEEVQVAGDADRHRALVDHVDPGRRGLQPRHVGLAVAVVTGRRAERVLDDHEMAAVAEGGLDLDAPHERPDALEDVLLPQERVGPGDHVGVAQAVARELADAVGDDRGGLGLVEPQAARTTRPRQLGGEEEQQAVLLLGQQPHRLRSLVRRRAAGKAERRRIGAPRRRVTPPSAGSAGRSRRAGRAGRWTPGPRPRCAPAPRPDRTWGADLVTSDLRALLRS